MKLRYTKFMPKMKKKRSMSDSYLTEQATRVLLQLVEDYERLAKELLDVNLEEVLGEEHSIYASVVLNTLNNIRGQTQATYLLLESLRVMKQEKNDKGTTP